MTLTFFRIADQLLCRMSLSWVIWYFLMIRFRSCIFWQKQHGDTVPFAWITSGVMRCQFVPLAMIIIFYPSQLKNCPPGFFIIKLLFFPLKLTRNLWLTLTLYKCPVPSNLYLVLTASINESCLNQLLLWLEKWFFWFQCPFCFFLVFLICLFGCAEF